MLGGREPSRHGIGLMLEFGGGGASFAGRRRRGRAGAFGGCDEAVGGAVAMFAVGTGARVEGVGGRGRPLALAQHLAHVDTAAREDAREDAGFERLALDAGETGQQRGRGDEVAAEPGAVLAALLDNVQLVSNLKGQVGGRRGLEWIGAYCEGDPRERPPARHGTSSRAICGVEMMSASRDELEVAGSQRRRRRRRSRRRRCSPWHTHNREKLGRVRARVGRGGV